LDWQAEVDASGIGVAAANGVVTLTGYIDSYAGKLAAERAVKRVRGVRAVANDLQVRLKIARTDTEIAQDIVRVLQMSSLVPTGVQAAVHNGSVTLTGTVAFVFQRVSAESLVRHVKGVRDVVNRIRVTPQEPLQDVRHRIVKALHRTADVDSRHIDVAIVGTTAILTGAVSTWVQREAAERAAASAPGIAHVDNRIAVEPPPALNPDVEIC
jgi:osmotically-inducible protein OsmY